MNNKLYKCQICDRDVVIRTKIKNKDSEYFGKSACPICASQHNVQKEKKQYRINPRTEKNNQKRKENRKDYSDFFKKHIDIIKKNNLHCEECNDALIGDVSEVCHIISKQHNPEIATEDCNIIYLCGMFSNNQCHHHFDSSLSKRKMMQCFEKSKEKVQELESKIIKKTNEYLLYYGDSKNNSN